MPFRHLLVAIDGSEMSERAFDIAASVALKLDARLTAVHALDLAVPTDMSFMSEASLADARPVQPSQRERDATEKIQALARKAGIECSVVIDNSAPWKAIVDVAQQRGCDLIVMATHGRHGAGAMLMGSETHKVMAHAKVPVLACR